MNPKKRMNVFFLEQGHRGDPQGKPQNKEKQEVFHSDF